MIPSEHHDPRMMFPIQGEAFFTWSEGEGSKGVAGEDVGVVFFEGGEGAFVGVVGHTGVTAVD